MNSPTLAFECIKRNLKTISIAIAERARTREQVSEGEQQQESKHRQCAGKFALSFPWPSHIVAVVVISVL